MESILQKAIQSIQKSSIAFSKYITANDTGATGAHQAGFHIHKNAWQLFFKTPGKKGTNEDKFVTIKWQDDFETQSRFIYYGTGTRNEYRLTRFGKGFPYLQDDNIGDLLIIIKRTDDYYEAFVLQSDEEIDDFFAELNISSTDTNGILPRQFQQTSEDKLHDCFLAFLKSLKVDFPTTLELATNSRNCYNNAFGITQQIIKSNPDKEILNWLNTEFQLFKTIEIDRYSKRIQTPFKTVEELVETANTILNRRKSRAGKSLEHHLSEIFKTFQLDYSTQTITEDNKKPDFIFPNLEAYHNLKFDPEKLVVLASKTTCKDRWRQILNEADRVKTKHLFTLQQGISKNQLEEMYKYNVCLVVPKPYLTSFPQDFKEKILTLDSFVKIVQFKQQ
ncbi:restriction endonuclease [Panacibacter ginsenosidivorans]|uniref:Restriction endonuclease n=1 Tax=Panacibacter ginsenosidivorans TaxID=1813871 RepID=A0A5B8V8U7_9BACT|nr:type II restriction endonuclease [Panacibacter ginsenosidivorans]QEC67834.1 restriction endonuclease [Panacibacter ginsenosidivorans]